MYRMIYIIFTVINFATAEWVELATIYKGKKIFLNNSSLPSYTTTPSTTYEVVMKTPYSKLPVTTTPIYDTKQTYTSINFGQNTVYNSLTTLAAEEEENDETPYNGFLSFLAGIQQNLLQSASRESKMTVLTNLRDLLLNNLYMRISKLWQKKPDTVKSEARGYKDDYEMDFPSNEGALMTIAFLTFAVFLIKLVIKLVHALKQKYMYYGTTTTTTTAANLIFLSRQKSLDEDTARILTYIENPPR